MVRKEFNKTLDSRNHKRIAHMFVNKGWNQKCFKSTTLVLLKIDKTHTFSWVRCGQLCVVWVLFESAFSCEFTTYRYTDTDSLIATHHELQTNIQEITMHGTTILLLSYRVVVIVINIILSIVLLFIFGHTLYCESKPMGDFMSTNLCVWQNRFGMLCVSAATANSMPHTPYQNLRKSTRDFLPRVNEWGSKYTICVHSHGLYYCAIKLCAPRILY